MSSRRPSPPHRIALRARVAVSAALALVACPLFLAPRPGLAWTRDPFLNQPVITALGSQEHPLAVADGAGGTFVAWTDLRSGVEDVYLIRILADGSHAPGWPADGLGVGTGSGAQTDIDLMPDGQGGVYLVWESWYLNRDIYIQRVDAAGAIAPGWPAGGLVVANQANEENDPVLAPDASGGAWVVYGFTFAPGDQDVYARRVNADGSFATATVVVTAPSFNQIDYVAAPDGFGGIVVAWADDRDSGVTGWDIYAQRLDSTGFASWTGGGIPVCNVAQDQRFPVVAAGPAGSQRTWVVWQDFRSGGGSDDVYATHLALNGFSPFPAGIPVSDAINAQQNPRVISDEQGGVIVVFEDTRDAGDRNVYAERVLQDGTRVWGGAVTGGGVPVTTVPGVDTEPRILKDDTGGYVVVWQRATDLWAQALTVDGAPRWTEVAVSRATYDQIEASVVSDARRGATVVWADRRLYGAYDLYGQRLDEFGFLGDNEPAISAVADVPNDQGGFIKVSWDRSPLDDTPGLDIYDYLIWRSVPPNLARAAIRNGATVLAPGEAPAGQLPQARALQTSGTGNGTTYWEYVGEVPAAASEGYSMAVASAADSVGGSNPVTLFRIEARAIGGEFWHSAPDSGYSVDNLAPAVPAAFAGTYSQSRNVLTWHPNAEPDLSAYRLYAGTAPDFIPGPVTFVAEVVDTTWTDPPGALHYKLSAVDVHGNEGAHALVSPGGTVGAPPLGGVQLAGARPNPFSHAAEIAFRLPAPMRVQIAVYDVRGRKVRTLLDGERPAGEGSVTWDGRDAGERPVAAGVYLVRLATGSAAETRRVVLVRGG